MIKLNDISNIIYNIYNKKLNITNISNTKKIFLYCLICFDDDYFNDIIFNNYIIFKEDIIDNYINDIKIKPLYYNLDKINNIDFINKNEKNKFFISLCFIFNCNIIINCDSENEIYFYEKNLNLFKKTIIFYFDKNNYYLLGFSNNYKSILFKNYISVTNYNEIFFLLKKFNCYILNNKIDNLNSVLNFKNDLIIEKEIDFFNYFQILKYISKKI